MSQVDLSIGHLHRASLKALGTPTGLVGIIGSGQIGLRPFDRQSWSGISYFFFKECQRQGLLHRAFGVEVTGLKRYWLLVRNFSPDRRRWRTRYYMDPRYRRALTQEVRRKLEPADFDHCFLQIGAMYNVPRLAQGRTACFSYHDGNMAQSLRSPHAVKGLNPRAVEHGLAFEREVYHSLTMIFTMSEYLRRSFIDDFGVPAERVRSIGAGINLERPPEYFPGKDYGKKEILFIGIDFVRKGGWELLRAFRTLRERFPEAQLHIVGPRQLTIPSELHHGVQYHGFLRKTDPADGARLQGLFRTSSLFVMPSLYEPFGIAPLEAMAYQLPCVLTNGWALKEMVTPGETGELVECGNADDLADKLTRLWASPGKLREMGETARKRVLEHHTWDKVVARLKHAVSAVGPASKVQR